MKIGIRVTIGGGRDMSRGGGSGQDGSGGEMSGSDNANDGSADARGAARRLDKWLWCTRFFKTRSLAAAAVSGGKVRVNGERIKPGRRLLAGDRVSVSIQGIVAEFDVLGLPERRGSASEAGTHYAETPASAVRRARLREQQRLADLSRPRPDARPDKRDRRVLQRVRRGQT